MNGLSTCECGAVPELKEMCSWPAQYKVECKCGKEVKGVYYGSHDAKYRHKMARKACMEAWNKTVESK
jgi:hypothetical protein